MKICVVTDEISADPETAFELGVEWGVRDFELRGYFFDRVPNFSPYQTQRLQDLIARYSARIAAISPGIFKIPYPAGKPDGFPLAWLDRSQYEAWSASRQTVEYHLKELLPRSLEYAHSVGSKVILIFGFDRGSLQPGFPPDEVLETLSQAAALAGSAGVQLAIENEAGFWTDTGARTAAVVKAVNHPALGVNWDPGNAFFEGEVPYPEGYTPLRGWVRHVHYKDAMLDAADRAQVTDEGQIDWEGQLKALAADGYDGYVSIETHLRPKVGAARAALEKLRSTGLFS